MSSDDAYAAFLEKANEDPNAGRASRAQANTTTESSGSTNRSGSHPVQAPQRLVTAAKDRFYVSDADEPFMPVCFELKSNTDGLPDEDEFLTITGSDPAAVSVSILDPVDWDTQGNYKPLIDDLRIESKGNDVRVYRVQVDDTRVEYWVVSTLNGQLLGYKAKAVES